MFFYINESIFITPFFSQKKREYIYNNLKKKKEYIYNFVGNQCIFYNFNILNI